MSSKIKGIIAGSAVLLLLIGALIALLLTAPKDDTAAEDAAESSTTSELSSLLYDKNPQTIQTLTIENEYGSYKVEKLGDSLYSIVEYVYIPLDTNILQSMLTSAASVTVEKTVNENAEDLSIYGLAKPKATVTAEFNDSDKTVKELLIGNDTPIAGTTYFSFKGENKVYTIKTESIKNYLTDKTNCIQKTVFSETQPKDENDTTYYKKINDMKIVRDDLDYEIEIKRDERPVDPNVPISNLSSYRLTSPVLLDLDPAKCASITEGVFGLTASQIAVASPTEEQLKEYGIIDPYASISMDTASGVFKMKVGNEYTDEDGKKTGRYCYVKDYDVIYVFDNASLPWVTFMPKDITTDLITNNYIYTVSGLDFVSGDSETHFTMTGNTEENYAVKLDGNDLPLDAFKEFYQFVLKAPAEEIYTEDTKDEPSLTVTIKCTKGTTDVLEFIPVADRRTVVKVNGVVSFKCKTSYVERLTANLELVKNGGDIITTW